MYHHYFFLRMPPSSSLPHPAAAAAPLPDLRCSLGAVFGSSEERAQPPPPTSCLSPSISLCLLPLLRPPPPPLRLLHLHLLLLYLPLLASSVLPLNSSSSLLPASTSFLSSPFLSYSSSFLYSSFLSSPPPLSSSSPPPPPSLLLLLLLQHQQGSHRGDDGCWTAVLGAWFGGVLRCWSYTSPIVIGLTLVPRCPIAVKTHWPLLQTNPQDCKERQRALYTREFDSNALYGVIRLWACTNFLVIPVQTYL